MIYFDIHNFTSVRVNKKLLGKTAGIVLKNLKIKGETEISLAVVGAERMKALNKKYRGENKATDVLSFGDSYPCKKNSQFIFPPRKILNLGEIVICVSLAKEQAKIKNHSLQEEMTVLLIHGILHLLGYDHEKSQREVEKMKRLEIEILEKINESAKRKTQNARPPCFAMRSG